MQPPFNSYCLELFLSDWLFQRKSIWKRSFPMLLARDLYFPPSLKRLCETRLLNSAKLIFGHPVYLWRQRSKYIGMGCDDRPVPNLDLPWRSSSQKIMGMEGKGQATKLDEFSDKCQRGEGEVIFTINHRNSYSRMEIPHHSKLAGPFAIDSIANSVYICEYWILYQKPRSKELLWYRDKVPRLLYQAWLSEHLNQI